MKITFTNKSIQLSILLSLIIIIPLLAYNIWAHWHNPLSTTHTIDPHLTLINKTADTAHVLTEIRTYHDIKLLSDKTDTVRALISFPQNYPETAALPVIQILGGINIGRENLNFIKNPGKNIIVVFLYDYDMDEWETGTPLLEVPKIRAKILKTPAQIAELQNWLLQQSWTDTNRVSLLGYSFGSLFLPAAKNLMQQYNIRTGPCILAYGGADFYLLMKQNIRLKPKWLITPLAWLLSNMIDDVDPLHHAPYMIGDFYLINGSRDKQIPGECWQLLHKLVRPPKKIAILDEGHMHPNKPRLTEKLIDMSRRWLQQKEVLN